MIGPPAGSPGETMEDFDARNAAYAVAGKRNPDAVEWGFATAAQIEAVKGELNV